MSPQFRAPLTLVPSGDTGAGAVVTRVNHNAAGPSQLLGSSPGASRAMKLPSQTFAQIGRQVVCFVSASSLRPAESGGCVADAIVNCRWIDRISAGFFRQGCPQRCRQADGFQMSPCDTILRHARSSRRGRAMLSQSTEKCKSVEPNNELARLGRHQTAGSSLLVHDRLELPGSMN